MLQINKIIVSIALIFALTMPSMVWAYSFEYDSGLQQAGGAEGMGFDVGREWSNRGALYIKVGGYIRLVLSFVGVLFLVLAIRAGYLWMTAQGNTTEVDKAKKILIETMIGLVVVTSAYVITLFIGRSL